MMCDVFNLFGKGKKSTTFKPPRAPGETIRPDDAQYPVSYTHLTLPTIYSV